MVRDLCTYYTPIHTHRAPRCKDVTCTLRAHAHELFTTNDPLQRHNRLHPPLSPPTDEAHQVETLFMMSVPAPAIESSSSNLPALTTKTPDTSLDSPSRASRPTQHSDSRSVVIPSGVWTDRMPHCRLQVRGPRPKLMVSHTEISYDA